MVNGVEIEQRLGGVLTRPVAAVENRVRRDSRGAGRCSLLEVADDDAIGIAADDANGVLDRFAFSAEENSRAFSVE